MITPETPSVKTDGRYTVSETCQVLCICRDSLRKYTKAGLIKYGLRRETGRKFYLGSEIIRFWKAQR